MELSNNIKEKVVDILNKIAILEFKHNSLLGEWKRISNLPKVKEDEKFKNLCKELEKTIKPYIGNYKCKISEFGSLQLLEETDKIGSAIIYVKKLELHHNLDLPYGYIMGKACTKTVTNEILNKYSYLQ